MAAEISKYKMARSRPRPGETEHGVTQSCYYNSGDTLAAPRGDDGEERDHSSTIRRKWPQPTRQVLGWSGGVVGAW